MVFKHFKPVTSSLRGRLGITRPTHGKYEKRLTEILVKHSGRNNTGQITVRHQGGRSKRLYRFIDFKRDKIGIKAQVARIEYDPNRNANIALLNYLDGEKRYILAPRGLKTGSFVESGPKAEAKIGNALPLKNIPVGIPIHNLEMKKGRGGQVVRGAGSAAYIQAKEKGVITIKLPSQEMRLIDENCYATCGQVGNIHHKDIELGKAGRKRYLGIRPSVRGVAMHPNAHPHGGGEGRSGIGMPSPKSPWGWKTLGRKTRKKKRYSDKYIIKYRH